MSAEKKWFDSMVGKYVRLYTTNAVLHGQLLEHDEDVAVIQGDGLPPLLVYKDYIISCSAAPEVRKDM